MDTFSPQEMDIRHVLDALAEPLLAVDGSARILHANAALKELLGWGRTELLGQPLGLVLPEPLPEGPGEPQGPAAEPEPAAHRRRAAALRTRARLREGGLREVEVRLSAWPRGEGEPLWVVSLRDLQGLAELERHLGLYRRLTLLQASIAQALVEAEDEEAAAQATLRACGEVEGWALGTWWRVEDSRLRPLTVWTAAQDLPLFVERTLRHTLAPGEGLVGRAWQGRAPLVCADVQQDGRFLRGQEASREGLHGALFTPVVGEGTVHGVLEFFSREPRQALAEDEAVAGLLGRQLGLFLDRQQRTQGVRTRDQALKWLWESDLLGLHVSNGRGVVQAANPVLLRLLDYTPQEVEQRQLTWASLVPERLRGMSQAALERLRREGGALSFEGEYLRKDGRAVPVWVSAVALGQQEVATCVLDLSGWRPAPPERPQLGSPELLSSLVAHAPVVLFALDRQGVFTLSEGGGLRALGLRPGQVVGASIFDVYRTEPAVLADVRRALAGEEFLGVDEVTGGLVWETHWAPLRDGAGRPSGCIGLAVDVTEREREARWRAQLLEQTELARVAAEEAVRMRDDFLTVASHELKTPLTALHLQVQALLRQAQQGWRRDSGRSPVERLEKAQQHLLRLVRLVDDLLDVSRVAAGRMRLELEQVDLVEVAREVLERFQEAAARQGTQLELRGVGSAVGQWDRTRLEQVVTNLVANALKYGPRAPVEVTVGSSGAMAMLEVRDYGIGINPQDLERIFGKFERAVSVRQYGGLGLGLFIVRQLVEALGGAITVESQPGEGAAFRVVLPLAGPPTYPQAHAGAELH